MSARHSSDEEVELLEVRCTSPEANHTQLPRRTRPIAHEFVSDILSRLEENGTFFQVAIATIVLPIIILVLCWIKRVRNPRRTPVVPPPRRGPVARDF